MTMTPLRLEPVVVADAKVSDILRNADLFAELKQAVERVADGGIECPHRIAMASGHSGRVTHVMTAKDVVDNRTVTKVVDYDPDRPTQSGLPSLIGTVNFLAPGDVAFVCNAGLFTNIRTAAATAFALDLMAPPGAHVLTVFGAGPLAREMVIAIGRHRTLDDVRIVSRSGASADRLAAELTETLGVSIRSVRAGGAAACRGADMVVTATSAVEPILGEGDIGPGTILAAVGSGTPERRELAGALVGSAYPIVVETREAALSEAGDLLIAAREGYLDTSTLWTIVDVLREGYHGDSSRIGLYKSVGAAWQDLACTNAIYQQLKSERLAASG